MKHAHPAPAASGRARRAALASPFRLELVGLFAGEKELSVSDMAERTCRPATSLYHHLGILEEAGILTRSGTRPKGKRFEALYQVVESRLELGTDPDDPESRDQVISTMSSALRMAERDFIAALDRDDLVDTGPARNCMGLRLHMRATPGLLADLNEALASIERVLADHATRDETPGPADQFISFTCALLPLRGRSVPPEPEAEVSP